MLAPKKTIPKLVVGMLALTGCPAATDSMPGGSGGDGGGAGGSGGMAGMAGSGGMGGIGGMTEDDLTIAARAWCMGVGECYDFGADPEDCTNRLVENYADESAECQAAALSYFECHIEPEDPCDFSVCEDYRDLRDARDDACD